MNRDAKQRRAYYYPPLKDEAYANPYSAHYREALARHFSLANKPGAPVVVLSLAFFLSAFRADVYIVNWLEDIAFRRFGKWQFLLVKLGLAIIRLRRKKIVWMFHNIHPHSGHNGESRWLHCYLFNHASLIISHSREAAQYARLMAKCTVRYVCHPVAPCPVGEGCPVGAPHEEPAPAATTDVFIWGTIIAYKGVREFLEENARRATGLSIRIVGACHDEELHRAIEAFRGPLVCYERRRASFDEIGRAIRQSRYVLFPYVGSCVSSSGALIDTIVMGGTPVGPRVGAFHDLEAEEVCLTYQDYDQLFSLLLEPHTIGDEARREFISSNTWERLALVVGQSV